MRYISLLLILMLAHMFVAAQKLPGEQQLLAALSNKDAALYAKNDSIILSYYPIDTTWHRQLLVFFEKYSGSENRYVAARSLAWRGIVGDRPPFNGKDGEKYVQQAVNKAVESGDECLMIQCFEIMGDYELSARKPEISLFYFMKSHELRLKHPGAVFSRNNRQVLATIGEAFYKMEEFEQAADYIKQSITASNDDKLSNTTILNTLGLAYQKRSIYDSSLYWYQQALKSAHAENNTVWAGIINGNMGALYFEKEDDEKALPLLWADYNATIGNEKNSAGNTLHRIALIYLRQNKKDSAWLLAKKSFDIVTTFKYPNIHFLRNVYFTMGQVFLKTGSADSAFHYLEIYHQLNDSVKLMVAHNRADVVQTRLAFEKTSNHITALLREKKTERTIRNLLLAGLLLLLTSGWFYLRWQKQKHAATQQKLLYEKELADAAIKNAHEQLNGFMENNIRKNELIENLQQQLAKQNMQVNQDLLNQSILTENDWLRFKDMFEKANPGFIQKLKNLAPDITTAEIRFAALTFLNIGNKHMADMLGVGVDAIRKTKSRLRQRLQLPADMELEGFLKNML